MDQLHLSKTKKGFVTLISVIILTAISVSIISTDLLISSDTQSSSKIATDTIQSRYLAETCVEVALNRLKINLTYSGNETIVTTFGDCQISTLTGSGNTNRSFTTTATSNNTTRSFNITVSQVNPDLILTQYLENLN